MNMKDDKRWCPTPGLEKSISELDKLLSRNSEYPILIQGPTGSGKTFFYKRIIDYFIDKKNNPNLPYKLINCAAISENLIEAELFGYVKGAFTGATRSKIGLLKSADKGVLILDEIGEFSKPLQAKLLTFFDTKEIRRVGSTEEVEKVVDVFIVGTTNAPEETFRKDFWHRFHKITVPPLYERRKDILYLMRQFCETTPIIGWQLLDCLCQAWDGNVREFEKKYPYYTQDGSAKTDELFLKLQKHSYLDFVNVWEILKNQLSHPLFLLKHPPFNRIADRIQKKFPTLFGTNVLNLSKFSDKRLDELYREFLLFCWHFNQHPCLNDNILKYIAEGETSVSMHFSTEKVDSIYDFDLKKDISILYIQKSKTFGSNQIDQEPPPDKRLSEPEPPPINHCDMKKVSPNDYYQVWLLYHLYIRKKSQRDIAKEFNIPTSTISRWVKKKLSPDTLKKIGVDLKQ